MGDDSMQIVRELGEVKAEVCGLKVEMAGVRERIDDLVIAQLRDHGKRLATMEAAENRRAGAMVVLSTLCGGIGAYLINKWG